MIRRTGALALLIAAVACAPAAAKAVTVNVRVEGKHRTLFDGKVKTSVHPVDAGDGSGGHKCDGTNGGANDTPAPTLFGAFDDAIAVSSYNWAGSWSDDFEDFGIDRVGPDSNDTTYGKYWGQALNYQDTQLGGCQIQVHRGDDVLVALNSYGHPKLRLKGPHQATEDRPFRVTVIDGGTRKPFEGARVRGKATDAKGHVMVTLGKTHVYRLKATSKGAIRSRALTVKVHAAG
jgi:hypothetical protein